MKTTLCRRVWLLADKYNIPQVSVHSIINTYIDYCKEQLYYGKEVVILGLVTLVPDKIYDKYKTTLAYDCKEIAHRVGLPSHTVYIIIREYIASLEEEILNGKSVEMRNLVTIHPIKTNGVFCKIHSAISTTIKNDISKYNLPINSVRVHTHKNLKYKQKEMIA